MELHCLHAELDTELDPAHFDLMACRIRVSSDGSRESEAEEDGWRVIAINSFKQ